VYHWNRSSEGLAHFFIFFWLHSVSTCLDTFDVIGSCCLLSAR
jgi:hypothetical protein